MPSASELTAAMHPLIREELERQLERFAVTITGGRRVRIPETGVVDPDPAHVSNADVLTALESSADRIVAAIARLQQSLKESS